MSLLKTIAVAVAAGALAGVAVGWHYGSPKTKFECGVCGRLTPS